MNKFIEKIIPLDSKFNSEMYTHALKLGMERVSSFGLEKEFGEMYNKFVISSFNDGHYLCDQLDYNMIAQDVLIELDIIHGSEDERIY